MGADRAHPPRPPRSDSCSRDAGLGARAVTGPGAWLLRHTTMPMQRSLDQPRRRLPAASGRTMRASYFPRANCRSVVGRRHGRIGRTLILAHATALCGRSAHRSTKTPAISRLPPRSRRPAGTHHGIRPSVTSEDTTRTCTGRDPSVFMAERLPAVAGVAVQGLRSRAFGVRRPSERCGRWSRWPRAGVVGAEDTAPGALGDRGVGGAGEVAVDRGGPGHTNEDRLLTLRRDLQSD